MSLKNLSIGGWCLIAVLLTLPLFVLFPAIDLRSSGLFFDHYNDGFWLRHEWLPNIIHDACQIGARIVAALMVICIAYNLIRKQKLIGLDAKAGIFILAMLLIGPGLVTNTVLKDMSGRARPYQVQEFDGGAKYTPPLTLSDQCDHNCSFISGDGALGFSLHTLFYAVAAKPRRRKRAFWWGWLGGGIIFGGNRVIMGSHFLSDVVFSGIFMLIVSAALHALFYGWQSTRDHWRDIICKKS